MFLNAHTAVNTEPGSIIADSSRARKYSTKKKIRS